MSVRLTPCPACARHVKLGDCVCPFCGGKVACRDLTGASLGRMSRSAMFAATALGTVLGATDCGTSPTPLYGGFVPPPEADASDASAQPADGSAPSDAATPADTGDETPSAVALYGGFVPPADATDVRNEPD